VLVAAWAAGCQPPPIAPPAQPDRAERLERELGAAKAEVSMLTARIAELEERGERLARELERVRFLKDQQDVQIKVLAGAIEERDRCKVRVEVLTAEVERLNQRLAELEAELRRHEPASAPSPQSED